MRVNRAQTWLCAIHIVLIEDVLATGNSSDNIRSRLMALAHALIGDAGA
jgi:hypothetical protein